MSAELEAGGTSTIGRPCAICSLSDEKRFETECQALRGDTWEEVGQRIGISKTSVRRHMESHASPDTLAVREWMQKHGNETVALALARKTEMSVLEGSGTVTTADVQRRFLVLERYAMNLLEKLDAQKDLRGALQVVTELRALTVALSTMNTRGVGLEETGGPEETEDVIELREKIVAQLLKERAAIANLECQRCGWRLQKPAS